VSAADWLNLGILSFLWGSGFFFAKVALADVPPQTLTVARVGIAAIFIVGAAWIARKAMPQLRDWRAYAIMALFNNAIPFSLIFWGQTQITSGLASILNATGPLFTLIVAHLWTHDDKFTTARAAGLVAGFAGVTVMIGPDLLGELGAHVLAEFGCLAAALSYGIGGVYTRRFRDRHPLTLASGQLIASLLILAPLAIWFDRPWALAAPSPTAIGAMLGLGILSTALAYFLYFRVLLRAGATNAMLVTLLIPVSAVLLGTLILDEVLTANQLAGAAIVALGLIVLDGRALRFLADRVGLRRATST
jgi:drug/metabolite transporter (DMT)-like permease